MPGYAAQIVSLNNLSAFFNSVMVAEVRTSFGRNVVWLYMILVNLFHAAIAKFLVDNDPVYTGEFAHRPPAKRMPGEGCDLVGYFHGVFEFVNE
jgi:hypothetical protein